MKACERQPLGSALQRSNFVYRGLSDSVHLPSSPALWCSVKLTGRVFKGDSRFYLLSTRQRALLACLSCACSQSSIELALASCLFFGLSVVDSPLVLVSVLMFAF